MATVADFLNKLPSFDTVEPATIQAWLDEAGQTVGPDEYGADYDRAQIYLAAHLMSLAGIGPDKQAKALVGISQINSASLSFQMRGDKDMGDYALTTYGRQYWPILRSVWGGIRVTGTGELPEGTVDVPQW